MALKVVDVIENAIAQLEQLTKLEVQPRWLISKCSSATPSQSPSPSQYPDPNFGQLSQGQPVQLNDKGYIVFAAGREICWLYQKIVIPENLAGYRVTDLTLRLVLTWWAEDAQIFINNELVQQGDLFDSSARVLVTETAAVGQEYTIAIRLVSPGHDIGALMRSHLLFERVNPFQNLDPGWFAKELAVLNKYLTQFEPEKKAELARAIELIDWDLVTECDRFNDCLSQVRKSIEPLAQNIKQRTFYPLGHAHLDMAWLWTTTETYEVAQRTFSSVLNLQAEYPQLTFGHTSPALYQWIETNRPDLFSQIQQAISNGKWEALGGMWIEPEVNLISGESIIRQLLYGQQYYQAKFGRIAKVAWLPDSFGFPWQLPQIMKQCGIEYFVTGKLHWNDTTKFPHGCFWWQSPDGTKLFTLMSPPNVTGVMDTNPLTMTNYAVDWETQTGLQDIFWLPGVGDHGGGPTRDMLEAAALWQESPFFPEIEFTTAIEYLDKISQNAKTSTAIAPTYNSELYLELHRGCYTTHGEQKRFNRYSENLLYQAELWATLAKVIAPMQPSIDKSSTNQSNTWQQTIDTAWQKVLFNQFHDILPGTSIPEVFTEANQEWQTAITLGESVLKQALTTISELIKLPKTTYYPAAKPLIVFNSLNWQRSQIIALEGINYGKYNVCDLDNNLVKIQHNVGGRLTFLAENIPSVGYKVYWLVPEIIATINNPVISQPFTLENNYLKVAIASGTGDIESIYDKQNNQEILSAPGNQLQAFTDKGQYWDAWNIDPDYETKQLAPAQFKSIEWLENSATRQIIRVVRVIGKSKFIQDYILETASPILKIATEVDWQETHVLVKAAFPLTIESDCATSEIACGAIARPTKLTTPADQAKWETAAHKWLDLTDESQNYGVSILNDCKYGYDIQPSQIRISLLRAPVWPDPHSDRGKHQFTYGIYPHQGTWQQAQTVRHAYELNIPVQVVEIEEDKSDRALEPLILEPVGSLLDLSAENLVLMAVKTSPLNPFLQGKESNTNKEYRSDLVLRCYECHGEEASLELTGDLDWQLMSEVNSLEEATSTEINSTIKPWQVKSYKLDFKHKNPAE